MAKKTPTAHKELKSPVGVVLYENLAKPDDGMMFAKGDPSKAKPKYGLTFLLPKRNDDGSENTETTAFVKSFNESINEICGKVNYKHFDPDTSPLKDGDATDEDGKPISEGKAGFWFLNLNHPESQGRITIIAPSGKEIIKNTADFPRRGDAVRVGIKLSYYEVGTNKGISAKPKGVQLVARSVLATKEALSMFADSDYSDSFDESIQNSVSESGEGDDGSEDDVPF